VNFTFVGDTIMEGYQYAFGNPIYLFLFFLALIIYVGYKGSFDIPTFIFVSGLTVFALVISGLPVEYAIILFAVGGVLVAFAYFKLVEG
jgi:hypothetical protein